jgi:hypothetical protein
MYMLKGKASTRINKMDMFMKGSGLKIYNMEKENSSIFKMGIFFKGSLCMAANSDKGYII